MKKVFATIALLSFMAGAMANTLGDDKKECSKGAKACCKKDGKACEKKTEEKKTDNKK